MEVFFTVNVYDSVNQTAKAIKESHEYKKLLSAKEQLSSDKDAQKMVKDFLKKQAELQLEAMTSKEPAKDKQEQLKKLYELLSLNEKSREYVQTYMRFQLMLEDIYKILGEAIKPITSDMENE